jgi:hypothetical protein
MENTKEKKLLYNDENLVEKVNVQAYKGLDNLIYLREESARYANCTHTICDCGNPMNKGWSKCEDCRHKSTKQKRDELPIQDWDGKTMIFDETSDKYFNDMEEIAEYLEENDLDAEDLDFYICSPNYAGEISSEHWADYLPEDHEDLPKELQQKLDEFNKFISDSKIILSWSPSKVRTKYVPENEN